MIFAKRLCAAFACVFLSTATAESSAWLVGATDDAVPFASTFNPSGEVLGQYCNRESGQCVWVLGSRTACQAGVGYDANLTSEAGSQKLTMHCEGRLQSGLHRYLLANYSLVDAAVRNGKRLKLDFALNKQGVDFDLEGGKEALDRLQAMVAEEPTNPEGGAPDRL